MQDLRRRSIAQASQTNPTAQRRNQAQRVSTRKTEHRSLLSFAQQRLWVLDRLEPGKGVYNLAFAVRLDGALDPDALKSTLDEIAGCHEILRAEFHVERAPARSRHSPRSGGTGRRAELGRANAAIRRSAGAVVEIDEADRKRMGRSHAKSGLRTELLCTLRPRSRRWRVHNCCPSRFCLCHAHQAAWCNAFVAINTGGGILISFVFLPWTQV